MKALFYTYLVNGLKSIMGTSELKQKVVNGTFWVLMERFSAQLVTFGVGIVLARILSPSDYGTVALLTIFTAIAGVLADSGFGNALVRKKDTTELDYNSVFYVSLAFAVFLYGLLFFAAPLVADYYQIPELRTILRVSAISLVVNSINSIQNAELNRKLLFHLSFRISILSTVSSAICGLSLACLGYGVWSLVWMSITASVVGMISRWFIIAWRPKLMFSFAALGPLWRYGWKISCSSLLDTCFNNLYGLVIGKCYSKEDLSFVNKGQALPQLLMNNINGTLGQVAFPALAKLQDNTFRVRESMRRMMVVSTFLVFPLMTVCAITSKNLILFLYGEKWVCATPFAMIACFTFALWPFHTINLQAVQAVGRSDIYLKLEIVKKIIALVVLVAFIPHGVVAWCLAVAFVSSPLAVVVNAFPNRRLLGYNLRMQILDILPAALLCGVAALPALALNLAVPSSQGLRFCVLAAQGLSAMLTYFALASIFRLRGIREISRLIKPKVVSRMPCLLPFFNYLENTI